MRKILCLVCLSILTVILGIYQHVASETISAASAVSPIQIPVISFHCVQQGVPALDSCSQGTTPDACTGSYNSFDHPSGSGPYDIYQETVNCRGCSFSVIANVPHQGACATPTPTPTPTPDRVGEVVCDPVCQGGARLPQPLSAPLELAAHASKPRPNVDPCCIMTPLIIDTLGNGFGFNVDGSHSA